MSVTHKGINSTVVGGVVNTSIYFNFYLCFCAWKKLIAQETWLWHLQVKEGTMSAARRRSMMFLRQVFLIHRNKRKHQSVCR